MGQMVTTRSTQPARKTGQANDSPQQYLTFSLGGEVFALGILNVKEIIEFGNITAIPMTPEFIRGVINLRGAVVPVIDLSARFGRKSTTVSRRTCIIIVEIESEDGRHELGVVVDAVNEVLEISPSEIEPPPSFGARIRADFIEGMGKIDGRFVIILSIERVLSTEEITLLAQIGNESSPATISE